ncbi:MAG: phosphoribosylanthranilate isomerase [Longimicrobiales bacterium]
MSATRFKVCCIQDGVEMRMAADAGATFAGLVGAMPSGPGPIPDARIAELVAGAPTGITPVLLTERADAEGIADHLQVTGVAAVQLVRHVPAPVREELRRRVPGLTILQVVHVEGPASVAEAERLAEGADYLLLDSGRPGAAVAELGGTGRTHDWSVSAAIVAASPVPVLLAGGLRPENVAAAVQAVGPWGVDVCSGLRGTAGRLDQGRLTAFARALA